MNGQKKSLMRTLLLIGMGLMIPCYLFTVGNTAFSPWELYDRNRLALVILTPLCLGLLLLLGRAARAGVFEKHERAMLVGFALFYLVCQLVMSRLLRFTPITDLEQCYTAAQLLVDQGGFRNLERPFIYFTRYPHNLGLVDLLAGIFWFFGLFGWADRFAQAALVCSLLFTVGLLGFGAAVQAFRRRTGAGTHAADVCGLSAVSVLHDRAVYRCIFAFVFVRHPMELPESKGCPERKAAGWLCAGVRACRVCRRADSVYDHHCGDCLSDCDVL